MPTLYYRTITHTPNRVEMQGWAVQIRIGNSFTGVPVWVWENTEGFHTLYRTRNDARRHAATLRAKGYTCRIRRAKQVTWIQAFE